jgi:hypothetical protein
MVPSIWICMINDKFLSVDGQTGCDTEEGIIELFKKSEYWKYMISTLDSAEEILYKKLLEEKTVKYFEITPFND